MPNRILPRPRALRAGGGFLLRRAAPAVLALVLAAAMTLPVLQVLHAHRVNGADGFPLDDAWIHLTYARQLHDGLGFVYSPGDAPTAGSTSPLYTCVLALLFGLTPDEKRLSYGLDIVCQAIFVGALALWARARLRSIWWTIAVVALVAFDARILILSTSGMETSLFLALVAVAFASAASGRWWGSGAAVAAAIWTRPEGILLAAVVAISAAAGGAGRVRRVVGVAMPAAVAACGYLAFNHALAGEWLPGTFAAKRAAIYPPIPPQTFLLHDVLPFLADHGWVALMPALIAGLVWAVGALRWHRLPPCAAEALWVIGVLAAYALLLPTGHRFDRYLVPVLPAAAIVAMVALQRVAEAITAARGRGWLQHAAPVVPLVFVGAGALHASAPPDASRAFATWCQYHAVRHERAGRWLAAHTPPDAVIATHDVGAIAFYSHRRIVDIAGLVTPEVVPHVRQPDFTAYLAGLFARRHVTHLAMLREWMQVTNVAPAFVADPRPEILEIFPWRAGVTHLVSREATSDALTAQGLLRAGRIADAATVAQIAVARDSLNADGWIAWGYALGATRRPDLAADCFARALRLRPGDRLARVGLARLAIDAERYEVAQALVDSLHDELPDDPDVNALAERIPLAPR